MNNFLKATIDANLEIHQNIKSGFKNEWFNEYEVGAGGDVSSGIDLFAESIFIKHLGKFGQIESEESGIVGQGDSKIIIDPLDGSSNALTNCPYFGSSVALINKQGLLEVAIVCNFSSGDIFYKFANQDLMVGSLENLEFQKELTLKEPKVGLFERSYDYPGVVAKLQEHKLKYRAPGAVALSLAYAHRVNFIIFIGDIRIYDFAAGLAFCEDLKVRISDNYAIVAHKDSVASTIEDIIKEEIV
jgi:myo-inositol-1(or 4)-monophosphatase